MASTAQAIIRCGGLPDTFLRRPVAQAGRPRFLEVGGRATRTRNREYLVPGHRADHGFEFRGDRCGSLSAIAKAATGSHVNGFRFFRLRKKAA